MPQSHIRNFSIIAHIDHGKSTLADRFIQRAAASPSARWKSRCSTRWTSSASAASPSRRRPRRCEYKARDGETYQLNLIDTPGPRRLLLRGARSLAACEGALLVVDASQGVEAQTVANCYTAIEQGVEVVPVLNKIDLPSADPEQGDRRRSRTSSASTPTTRSALSAKTGEGIDEILEAVDRAHSAAARAIPTRRCRR